jgi:uncharacterized protein YutE (UPF0331/DUF86 family)
MILKSNPNLPKPLQLKIQALQSEEDAYAADELVELGEEILSQLAAMGIAAYLKQAKQKEVFNDFLISLFLSNGHAYNAGPLYRWAANMIKDAEREEAARLMPFFWDQKEDGAVVLNEKIHHFTGLRNAVMHGFFVLPPERNREEAKRMEEALEQIAKAQLFETNWGAFHFLDQTHFNGHWNIQDAAAWKVFEGCAAFGELASRIQHEYAPSFQEEEVVYAKLPIIENAKISEQLKTFLGTKQKGAFVIWSDDEEQGANYYRVAIQAVELAGYQPLFFALHEKGASFTSSFLLYQLGAFLVQQTNDDKASKDPLKYLKNNKEKLAFKPAIVLHQLHIALFNQGHLTMLFNELYALGVPVIATSMYYSYLKKFANQSSDERSFSKAATQEQIEWSLHNYLRFKGPNKEQAQELDAYNQLRKVLDHLFETLQKDKKVVARRFADQYQFPIEYVHEAFAILAPYFQEGKDEFIKDEVDELYGFPKTIEESSHIFLTLGRRDVKLEYQHKVLLNQE